MKNNNTIILLIAILLVVGLFINPFDFWMPTAFVYMLLASLLIVFAIFAGFVWQEGKGDEREQALRSHAGRIGYIATTTTLVVGIVVQALTDYVDPWLVAALGVAVVAKLVAYMWAERVK